MRVPPPVSKFTVKFLPVCHHEHEKILGEKFSSNFHREMKSYYEPFLSKNRDVQLAKETWEYAVADSMCQGVWQGAGHSSIDVSSGDNVFDVKGLSCRGWGGLTTEASLLQSLNSKTDNCQELFEQQNYSLIHDMFVDSYRDKISEYKNFYLFCIFRNHLKNNHTEVHYCLLKPTITLCDSDYVLKSWNSRAVDIPLIDSEIGKTYVYIPKRRLEIRLNSVGISDYSVYSHTVKPRMFDDFFEVA
jgi:hypothetical protein